MLTMNIQGRGGDRAHEATTILVRRGLAGGGRSDRSIPSRSAKGCAPGSRRSCTSPAAAARRSWRTGAAGAADARGPQRAAATPTAEQLVACLNTRACTIRCSAAPMRKSAPTPAAITNARALGGLPAASRHSASGRGGGGGAGGYSAHGQHHPRRERRRHENVAVRRHRYSPGRRSRNTPARIRPRL